MASNETVNKLVQQLMHHETRAQARRRLLDIGPDAAPQMLDVLRDTTLPENMRWSAITLLSKWQIRDACDPLLEIVRDGGNLRGEAVRALESITGLEIGDNVEEWDKALQDPEAYRARQEEQETNGGDDDDTEEGVAVFKEALAGIATEMSWEDAGYLYMRIPLEGGRKQQMAVTFDEEDPSGQPLATVYTECGEASDGMLDSITRRNVTSKYGKFEVEETEDGNAKVIMRQHIPANRLSADLAREVVTAMAAEADSLELEMTGADHI